MATTQDQVRKSEDEFSAGFNEPDQQKAEMSEDEAFGLQEEPAAQEAAEAPGIQEAESAAAGGTSDGDPAVAIVIEPGAEDDAGVAQEDGPTDPKDIQREKSWEGRLKAREAELKAREDALAANSSPAAEPAEEVGGIADAAEVAEESAETPQEEAAETPQAEAIEHVAEQVESGQMTADEALQTLSQDFGEEFTKMLSVLIESKAAEVAGKTVDAKGAEFKGHIDGVNKSIDGIVNEIVGDKARAHFEFISEVHPDFMEVAESSDFKAWVDGMPAADQERAMKVIGAGSARQINNLISAYKASKQQPEQKQDDPALNAAEGVRSAGLKLPAKPAASQDYSEAWDSF